MKKILLIIGATLPVLVLVSWVLFSPDDDSDTLSPGTFPLNDSTAEPIPTTPVLTVATNDNSGELSVNNFITNGETVTDVVNPGRYVLAGSLGYCLSDGTCPSGAAEAQFDIAYNQSSDVFTVTLMQEPLAEARLEAATFLMDRLQISATDLCRLNASVMTPSFVNDFLAGEQLGFANCSSSYDL